MQSFKTLGLCCLMQQISFNFLGVGIIVGECGVDFGEGEMWDAIANLFSSQSSLVRKDSGQGVLTRMILEGDD